MGLVARSVFMRWFASGALAALVALSLSACSASAAEASYKLPPTGVNQWYWEIDPPDPGLAGLPAARGAYPSPGSADIWDTDLFQDSNAPNAGIPTGPSPVVRAIHAAGHYSICYVEAGAYQVGFPDDSNFTTADYGGVGDTATQMQGYPDEYWFNLTGFADYVAGEPATLTGAAVDIATQLNKRFQWCKLEGQDAVEPDDLDGYTNKSQSGVTPWGMTQADSAGFERWLAYDIHADGLAAFQKNDPANEPADASLFDGMIIEECNYYNDPCSGPGGDATAYLAAGKPVLNAEYLEDGESTAKFCSADIAAGIAGALFSVSLSGGTYQPCAPGGRTASAPVNRRAPVLRGTAKQGRSLSVSRGLWLHTPTSYSYRWRVCRGHGCTTVAGATKSSFRLTARDVGTRIRAVVTAHNAHGAASATSAASAPVAAARR
jgi:hypothetical protein